MQTHMGKGSHSKMEAKIEVMLPQGMHADCRQPPNPTREGHGTDPPLELPEGTNPPDTLISDFWLQNCKKIHFCCLKPPSLWYFVTVALGN